MAWVGSQLHLLIHCWTTPTDRDFQLNKRVLHYLTRSLINRRRSRLSSTVDMRWKRNDNSIDPANRLISKQFLFAGKWDVRFHFFFFLGAQLKTHIRPTLDARILRDPLLLGSNYLLDSVSEVTEHMTTGVYEAHTTEVNCSSVIISGCDL